MINTDKELIYADLTYKVFNVFNELGFGHKETVNQKALIKELKDIGLPFKTEFPLNVKYKGEHVGNYRPDFLIDEKVIIELKSVDFMPKKYEIQLLHYLKTTGYSLGLLINFGSPKLYIKRLVWTDRR